MSHIRQSSHAIRLISLLLILSLSLTGCQSTKGESGAALGATLGAVAGSFFGRGAGKAIAIGIGLLAGGFIGYQIGKHLDEHDRKAVELESLKALSQSKDGQTTTWKNPDTQAEAEITLTKTENIERKAPIVRSKNVQLPDKLTLIGEPYEIRQDANVRLGPSTSCDVAQTLKKGDIILAVGKVEGKNWILVNQNRHAIGYIHASLLGKQCPQSTQVAGEATKTTDTSPSTKATGDIKTASDGMVAAQTLRPAVDVQTMADSYPDTIETRDYVADQVNVEATARTLNMKIKSPKGEENVTVVATKSTDGAWEVL